MVFKIGNGKSLIIKEQKSLVRLAVEVYSALFVDKKYRLRKREFEFFVGCVIAQSQKIDIGSDDFLEFMQKEMQFSKSLRYIGNMRYVLAAKRWLKPVKRTYEIPPAFTTDLSKLQISIDIKAEQV